MRTMQVDELTNRMPRSQSARSRSFLLIAVGLAAGALAMLGVDAATGRPLRAWTAAQSLPAPTLPTNPTVQQLLLMPDADLARYTPADLNMLVGREAGVPADLSAVHDTVAAWSQRLRPVPLQLASMNTSEHEQFWVQVVANLQQQLSAKIVSTASTTKEPKDLFLPAAFHEQRFTPHTLPLLLAAFGQEWNMPLALVADNDRLICRIQCPGETAVNLVFDDQGATKPTDQQLIRLHGIPAPALKSGSDLQPLTNRQLLAWFLGQRSGVFLSSGDLVKAEADLLLARSVFPDNRSLFLRMTQLMERRGPQVLGATAWAMLRGDADPTSAMGIPRIPRTAEEVMRLNQQNRRGTAFADPMPGLPDIMHGYPGGNP